MQFQQMGYLNYQLYKLGWRSGLHQSLPLMQHILLSLFLYYRRGFTDSSEWIQEYCPEKRLYSK